MRIADKFLMMYDTCKQTRSPESCRQTVASAAPTILDIYLRSYDACLRGFSPEACRKVFAPAKTKKVSALKWFGAGLLAGFVLRRII